MTSKSKRGKGKVRAVKVKRDASADLASVDANAQRNNEHKAQVDEEIRSMKKDRDHPRTSTTSSQSQKSSRPKSASDKVERWREAYRNPPPAVQRARDMKPEMMPPHLRGILLMLRKADEEMRSLIAQDDLGLPVSDEVDQTLERAYFQSGLPIASQSKQDAGMRAAYLERLGDDDPLAKLLKKL